MYGYVDRLGYGSDEGLWVIKSFVPPSQSGRNADLIEFMREQAREQREWLSQYQKATQEAQKEVTSMMTSMMSAIVGSLKKAG